MADVDSHFLKAVSLDEEPRREYLTRLPNDIQIAVESMLAADESVNANEEFLSPFTPDTSVKESDPTQVGPYRVLQRIGTGGMGRVYMAQQSEPFKRRVAVKVIITDTPTAEILARFEAERQALAMMNHPNIASVLDAGMTAEGRPYIAMELVNGISITEYCDQNQLRPRERLKLFMEACRAIQHAHQKGVIHRDIKPKNILVGLQDSQPTVKVIDFGLAKAIGDHARLTDKTVVTDFGKVVGTWQYMSPEQAEMNALNVDTRTDVYSLGVLLYELLTGTTPLTREQANTANTPAGMLQLIKVIREEEAPKPSTRLSRSGIGDASVFTQRSIEPKKLGLLLRGDLDWIAIKALEKDRTRRYDGPAAMADDVERFLASEPIVARPPSRRYLVGKFVRRNGRLVIGATIIATSIVSLAVFGLSMWRRAESSATDARTSARKAAASEQKAIVEADDAQEAKRLAQAERKRAEKERDISAALLDFMQSDLLREASVYQQANRPGGKPIRADLTVRDALLNAAKRYAPTKIEERFPGRPLVQLEVLRSLGETLSMVEAHEEAVAFSTARLRITERIYTEPVPPELQQAQLEHLFVLAHAADHVGVASSYAQVLQNLEDTLELTSEDFPHPESNLDDEIDARVDAVFNTLHRRLDPRTFQITEWLEGEQPTAIDIHKIIKAVAPTISTLKRIHQSLKARYSESDERVLYSSLAIALQRHGGADVIRIASDLFAGRPEIGLLMKVLPGDLSYAKAIQSYEELLSIAERHRRAGHPIVDDARLAGARLMLGIALQSQGLQLRSQGQQEAATASLEQAAEEMGLSRLGLRKALPDIHPAMMMVDSQYAYCLSCLGRTREEEPILKDLIVKSRVLSGPDDRSTTNAITDLGHLYASSARVTQNSDERKRLFRLAIEQFEKAHQLELKRETRKDERIDDYHAWIIRNYAQACVSVGDLKKAESLLKIAWGYLEPNIDRDNVHREESRQVCALLANVLRQLEKHEERIPYLRHELDHRLAELWKDHPLVMADHFRLAVAYETIGDKRAMAKTLKKIGRTAIGNQRIAIPASLQAQWTTLRELRALGWVPVKFELQESDERGVQFNFWVGRHNPAMHFRFEGSLTDAQFDQLSAELERDGFELISRQQYSQGSKRHSAVLWHKRPEDGGTRKTSP